MLFWECRRRFNLLTDFRLRAFDYFENIAYAGRNRPPSEHDNAQKARHAINLMMNDVRESFALLGIDASVRWTPPPMIGGYVQDVDVFLNMFELWRFQLPPAIVFDHVDRAIGTYERECRRLRRQIFNPFYWLNLLIIAALRLPFRLIGAAGFDAEKAENSILGRLSKLAIGTVLFFAAVIPAILALSDHWEGVKRFGALCSKALHRP